MHVNLSYHILIVYTLKRNGHKFSVFSFTMVVNLKPIWCDKVSNLCIFLYDQRFVFFFKQLKIWFIEFKHLYERKKYDAKGVICLNEMTLLRL